MPQVSSHYELFLGQVKKDASKPTSVSNTLVKGSCKNIIQQFQHMLQLYKYHHLKCTIGH